MRNELFYLVGKVDKLLYRKLFRAFVENGIFQ